MGFTVILFISLSLALSIYNYNLARWSSFNILYPYFFLPCQQYDGLSKHVSQMSGTRMLDFFGANVPLIIIVFYRAREKHLLHRWVFFGIFEKIRKIIFSKKLSKHWLHCTTGHSQTRMPIKWQMTQNCLESILLSGDTWCRLLLH